MRQTLQPFLPSCALALAIVLGSALSSNAAAQSTVSPAAAEQPAAVRKPAKKARSRKSQPRNAATGGETTPERERRLKRECRGMPNAGACLGYTR